MADFNKPTVDSEYTQFPTEIRAAISAALSFLDGEHTNIPLKAKRWNPSSKIFEEYNGTQWVPMATEYKLPVDYNSLKNKPTPNSAVDDESNITFASSAAVKTAYDKAEEAEKAASAKQSPATTLAGYGIGNFKIENFVGNVNSLQTDGIYAVTQASRSQNLPVAGNGCHIQVIAGGDGRWCRQIAYIAYSTDMYERHQTSYQTDSWSAWKKLNTDGIPVGAVVSFPRVITNPVGFLKANGTTFNQQTFPDLYQVLGNSNKLPDLTRSDVGMTAYFAVDNIPAGWIAFDEIATQVTEQRYPELYRHLVGKYGSIAGVPKTDDRFIRNAGNGLSVGQTQGDAIRNITGHFGPLDNELKTKLKTMLDGAFYLIEGEKYFGLNGEWNNNNPLIGFDASKVVPTAEENRPKSLVLKLCIKAINSLDDVVFWIKSHGEVTNAGTLDAGRLAQGLQDKADRNHTHTASQITDFNQATSQIINAAITYQKIGNVEIRKYPDGTMIQTGLIVFTRGDTTVQTDLVLPIAYVDKEYRCFITERYESRASGKGQYNWVFMQPKTNTTATVTSWYLGAADWMIIGRYK